MKIWNLNVGQDAAGGKTLNVQIHGEIDGGWFADESTSTAEIAKALAEHQDAKQIETHINSIGGSLFGGVAIYNILNAFEARGAKVTSYVDGLAASAASIIAMAGKTVMGRGAMLMIHNPMALAYGDAAELRRTAAVADKARESLLAVYKAKTGKDATALKAMLDAETWMGAEQALRQGFANEIADGGEEDLPTIDDLGDKVILATVSTKDQERTVTAVMFPRASVPAQIFAVARLRTPHAPTNSTPPGGQKPPEEGPMDRKLLEAKHPELLKALLDEGKAAGIEEGKKAGQAEALKNGHAEGVKAERERMKAIDDLKLAGCDDLELAAKNGDKPSDAPTLAVTAIQAGNKAVIDILAARKNETAIAAGVRPTIPQGTEESEMAAAKNIAKFANDRTGGSK